jgi:uncharacterized membrane protein YesL
VKEIMDKKVRNADAFEHFYKLMVINLLWFMVSLFGLVALTWMPATIAMYILIDQIMLKEEFPPSKTFFIKFKDVYWKSQKVFILVLGIAFILYVDFAFFYQNYQIIHPWISLVGLGISLLLVIFFLFTLVHLAPVFIHFSHLSVFKTVKMAFLISLLYPLQTFLIVLMHVLAIFLVLWYPFLLNAVPIILFSVLAYLSLLLLKPKYLLLLSGVEDHEKDHDASE